MAPTDFTLRWLVLLHTSIAVQAQSVLVAIALVKQDLQQTSADMHEFASSFTILDDSCTVPDEPICFAGWHRFVRPSGVVWCTMFRPVAKTWKDAQADCANYGAYLTGFETSLEHDDITTFAASETPITNVQIFLGGYRNSACTGAANTPYNPDPSSACSRQNVFQWMNGVGSNAPNNTIGRYWTDANPSFSGGVEICLAMVIGQPYHEVTPYTNGQLNDNDCSVQTYFICGRAAQ